MLDEGADAALVLEQVLAAFAALIAEGDLDAGIEERQFAQALGQDVVVELDVAEDLSGRLEAQQGAALVGSFELLERIQRLAQRVFLLVMEAIAPHIQPQVLGQRVDHRDAHAVQTAGNLVAVVVELTAGMQHGHDDFGGRNALFLVDVDRDAATVVIHRHRAVFQDLDHHIVGMAGEGFVDGVVDHLEHHVVQAGAVMDVADVHARTLADGLQAAQHGDLAGIVIAVGSRDGDGFFGHSLRSPAGLLCVAGFAETSRDLRPHTLAIGSEAGIIPLSAAQPLRSANRGMVQTGPPCGQHGMLRQHQPQR